MAAEVVKFKAFINRGGAGSRDTSTTGVDILMPSGDLTAVGVEANAEWLRDLVVSLLLPTSVLTKVLATRTHDATSHKLARSRPRRWVYNTAGTNVTGGAAPHKPAPSYVCLVIEKNTALSPAGRLILRGAIDSRLISGDGGKFVISDANRATLQGLIDAAGNPPTGTDVLVGKEGEAPRQVTGYVLGEVIDNDPFRTRLSKERALAKAAEAERDSFWDKAEDIMNTVVNFAADAATVAEVVGLISSGSGLIAALPLAARALVHPRTPPALPPAP